jgi:hypothetical protein
MLPAAYRSSIFLVSGTPAPLPAAFAIVTACNPMDRPTSDVDNRSADDALRRELERQALPHFRATGCSPDLVHREPGWAIPLPKSAALALAQRFGQRAIWWIEHDALFLISCLDGAEEFVDRFSARIRQPPTAPSDENLELNK